MKTQFNRLGSDAGTFSGSAIDRSRPLRFRLDGRLVSGFAGDSVLSAVLASGIDILGRYRDTPLGLTPGAHPPIAPAREPHHALSMARTPAIDGADFVTLGRRHGNPLERLFRPGRSLGTALDEAHALDRPWRTLPGEAGPESDLVIIGGGVAGMSAALAAAKLGLAVLLVEAGLHLGGHSGLFGTQEGENAPEADMARLRAAVEASDAIIVLTGSHAYALRSGLVRIHRIEAVDGTIRPRVLDLRTRHIVLATGSRERLPIFAGNRLPGVLGTLDAYELASRYGVWPGRTALVATSSNVAYRLAMLASDAGIAIGRILDSRAHPSSRFIEFSRAYGIVQVPGASVRGVDIARAGGPVSVQAGSSGAEALVTERLLVCGGWQPDLTLWHIAGGASHWHAERHRLEAVGSLDSIALAGSAAGCMTRQGCIGSGVDAVNALLGRARKPVVDPVIDPLYESPDAPPSIALSADDAAPAFLDGGRELLRAPLPRRRRWTDIFRREKTANGLAALSEAPQPLTICDVAAGVDLGLVPPGAAGIVAQERVALIALVAPASSPEAMEHDLPAAVEIPDYLRGRFGAEAKLVRIVPDTARQLSSGALLYRRSDISRPLDAVGVILRPLGEAAIALIAADAAQAGLPVSVRDQGRPIAARIEIWEGGGNPAGPETA